MSSRVMRVVAVGLLLAAMLALVQLVLATGRVPNTVAQGSLDPGAGRLERLAQATGRAADRLEIADESSLVLLNGRRLTMLKAIDRATGETVGAAFEDERIVDGTALLAQSAEEWHAQHGALTPELVAAVSVLTPGEQLNVVVWLHANVNSLLRPDRLPPAPVPQAAESALRTTISNPEKQPAEPLTREDVPAEVLARLELRAEAPESTRQDWAALHSVAATQRATLQQVETFRRQNTLALKAQIAPMRARFLDLLRVRGWTVQYASDIVPMVYLAGVTRGQVEELAGWPGIDAIYVVPPVAGPALAVARPTQNVDLINSVGYNGAAVKVAVVEGERIFLDNPYLGVTAVYSSALPDAFHPTGVGGIIASTHPAQRGLADGASLYSANGSYSDFAFMSAALDWGAVTATILNNSYYWQDNGSSPAFFELDRHLDYLVRYNYNFATVAAGNFGAAGCGPGTPTPYVTTPGKGYNTFTVGNYDDNDSLNWSDDAMQDCSSFGDPGHSKPEVAAVGSGISSTINSDIVPIAPIGSGTSYASPMVAALAADLIQADPDLAARPAALRSILMATALHNVEGSPRYSDKDGAGGVLGTAAIAAVERGDWAEQTVISTSFPITYTAFAYKGERVRFVINWLSNPDTAYTVDPLPADLDLRAYQAGVTTPITSSLSALNNFEVVDFVAPASDIYQFAVSRFSWTGGSVSTTLGAAWWTGTQRVAPDTGNVYSDALPLGTHWSVHPAEWPNPNFWRFFAVRPYSSDHDLALYTTSWFDDPVTRTLLSTSVYGTGLVDLIAVDGNHRPSSLPDQYRVKRFGGSGGYSVSWSNQGLALNSPGFYGPYTLTADEVVKAFDVRFSGYQGRRITVVPISDTNDLAIELFGSDGADSATWIRKRGAGVARADAAGAGLGLESLSYLLPSPDADWLGLAVFTKQQAEVSFLVYIENLTTYLPALLKD